jgi:multiple sugar transport system ATP-binding protein
MAEIELRGVTKRYPDGTDAVKNIDLTIRDGELMILVGPSGCGKTTTLRMIAGLEEITSGTLRIGGRVVNNLVPKDRDIAMVFQSYALYPHMSVRKNMGFALKLAKVKKPEIDSRVQDAAATLDLMEHIDRKPANLSGGQRQRVAMGRAIVRDPQAFLMDEPLSNLDAQLRVQMRIEVARLQQRLGTTMVYVTHDQVEAMTLGHRVAVMNQGLIQQVDTPQGLYNDPQNLFVARFIGSPPINLLPARLTEETIALPFGEFPLPDELRTRLPQRLASNQLIAGIRPEAFGEATSAGGDTVGFAPRIDVVELLGSETYVYFTVEADDQFSAEVIGTAERSSAAPVGRHGNEVQVVARLAPTTRASVGQEVALSLDVSGLKLFDPRTGDSVLEPSEIHADGVQEAQREASAVATTDAGVNSQGPVS